MPFFEIRAEAQQFTGRESTAAVAELVNRFRPDISGHHSDLKAGVIHFTTPGPDLRVEMGSWAVALGGDVIVMSADEFNAAVIRPVEGSAG